MKKQKIILHAMGMTSKKFGGLEKYMLYLAEKMTERGFKTVFVYNEMPRSQNYVTRLKQLGCEIYTIDIGHPLKYTFGYLKIIFKLRPDIVQTHFEYYLPIILSALTLRRHRFIMLHSMLVGKDSKPIKATKGLNYLTNAIRIICLKVSTDIICVSEAIQLQYNSLFRIKHKTNSIYLGHIIKPLPVIHETTKRVLHHEKVNICCIAFNSPVKGLDILLRALSILKRKNNCSNFRLYQVGVDIELKANSELLKLAENEDISSDINWLGIKDNILEILPEMDIYCQPSRSEGLPFSIVEASLSAIPSIGSNVGGIPEAIKDGITGLLFENENINDLVLKLKDLVCNEGRRKKMGEEAYLFACEKFNASDQSKKLIDFYFSRLNSYSWT